MPKNKKDENISPERETRVLLEDIRSEVKKIDEGHGGLAQKLEEHDKRFDVIDRRFDILEAAVSENGRDIKELKKTVNQHTEDIKEIKTTVKQLDGKVDKVLTDHEDRITKLEVTR